MDLESLLGILGIAIVISAVADFSTQPVIGQFDIVSRSDIF